MSQENAELVKALIPRPDVDFVSFFSDEQNVEALRPFFTDDFESVIVWPGSPRTYAGLDGLRKNWLDWLEPWATYRTAVDEVIDLGERVVVLVRNHGRRHDTGIEIELIGAVIVTFRGGKVARWEDWTNRAEALEAAGLRE